MAKVLFEQGESNMVSPIFAAPATITGYNLASDEYVKDDNGMTIEVNCGDVVVFEKVLTEADYDIDCNTAIQSNGIRASTPLMGECGERIKLTACNNIIEIKGGGSYHAIYIGDGRENAIVTKD